MTIDPHFVTRELRQFPFNPPRTLQLPDLRPGIRAHSAAHGAYKVAEQYLNHLPRAKQIRPDDIAPEQLDELRTGLVGKLKESALAPFTAALDGYIDTVERATAAAAKAAEPFRPVLDPESTAQMVRTDQAWNNSIKPMLDAGKQWPEIIDTLDTDGVLAVKRFAAGHEAGKRDQFHQHEVPQEVSAIEEGLSRRVEAIAPPEGRAALRDEREASARRDFVRTVASWVSDAHQRINPTEVSIGLIRSAHAIGAHTAADTSPEALTNYEAKIAATPRPSYAPGSSIAS